jgi:hypothetical protein
LRFVTQVLCRAGEQIFAAACLSGNSPDARCALAVVGKAAKNRTKTQDLSNLQVLLL